MTKKLSLEVLMTLFISVFLYGLIDFSFFFPTSWHIDKVVNFLHLWLSLLSAYYLYNYALKEAFKRWNIDKLSKLIYLLFGISLFILLYAVLIDILYYRLYYGIPPHSLKEETTFYELDLPIAVAVITLGSLYFSQKYYVRPINNQQNSPKEAGDFKVKANKGKSHIYHAPEEIGLFYYENGIVWIQTLNGDTYHTNYTLASLLEMLDHKTFFRLNRQNIISRAAVKETKKLDFQKLKVTVTENLGHHKPLIVSKYTSSSFKRWLTNSS